MASDMKEVMGRSGSAVRDGSMSQPLQAGPAETAADSWCPI